MKSEMTADCPADPQTTADSDPIGMAFIVVLVLSSFALIAIGQDIGWLMMGIWMGRMS